MNARELIRQKIQERGLSMGDLSKNVLGRNHAYLQQYLERGVPAKLPEDMRLLLAPALGVAEEELREHPRSVPKTLPAAGAPAPRNIYESNDRLKVLGMAECGPDGWSLWNGDVIDMVDRPANLRGVPGAYAVYVVGASMEPRYYQGELVMIHPGKPVTGGAFVLVQRRPRNDGDTPLAVVKRLVKRTATKTVLEQFNPGRTFEIRNDDIVSIHRVVGSGEA
jgi:phage repressor protein C with HTH and peptisase S24 domain